MATLLDPSQVLEMLEGNRRLTLRTVKAFSEQDLFHYSPVEPMRPFAAMIKEILWQESSMMRGVITGDRNYATNEYKDISSVGDLLEACEAVRRQTREWWPQLTVDRLVKVEQDRWGAARQIDRLLSAVENETHHRGQGFVYLRMLGIEPPFFWDR